MTGINLNIKKEKKMTNKEAFELLSKEREFSNLTGWSFVRILSINFDTIKKEYDLAKKYLEPSEELKNLMHKKNAILYKYAEKNENGEPIVIEVDNNKQYKLTSDNESKALEEIKELEKEGSDVLQEGISNYNKYMEILEEDFKGDIITIDSKILPKEITYGQLSAIKNWINM